VRTIRESRRLKARTRPEQLHLLPIAPMTPKALGATHVVVGLFAGIGGIERGLHRSGHRTVLLCENDAAAVAVLTRRFPGVPVHLDVCDLHRLPQGVSLLTAGFPCQDLSQTGATRGIAGSRSRLVGQVFRLLEKYRTPWVLLENVPFMLQLARGEAMNVITTAFENLGYRWAYRVVDARAFGLPQRRRRVFFLATNVGDPRDVLFADEAGPIEEPRLNGHRVACGFYWTEGNRGLGWAVDAVPTLKGGSTLGIPSPPAILLEDGRVVTPSIRDGERLQGFPKDWTKPAEAVTKRGTRWKLVGNAVSVRAAEWLGRRLARPGRPLNFDTSAILDSHHWPDAAWNIGEGRVRVDASDRPVAKPYCSLSEFLLHPLAPLSIKATAGFLSRARKARLKFAPGFLDALRVHLDQMEAQALSQSRVSSGLSVRSASRVSARD
jgi:DNA (cytosine-5)-methyltransferase 1